MLRKSKVQRPTIPYALPIRDIIKGLRRERARELLKNAKTGADIPKLRPTLYRGCSRPEIAYADALLVRGLPDGRHMIIDGHLRAETTPDVMVRYRVRRDGGRG